ncbi:PsiF family protein [Pelomonas sp. KK5]|uniref:PsiF family protein n=1 Tax=Pelomonas sp. KK5 TaxID=1855730 RepID=UPI0009FA8AC4
MKKPLISLIVLAVAALGSGAAMAKDSAARTAQRERMKTCNADAKAANKKGADRKAFMKECLSAKKA